MNKTPPQTKHFFIALSVFTFFFASISFAESDAIHENKVYFHGLKQKLVTDGFDAGYIDSLYANEKTIFDSEGIGLFFIHNEGILNYESFANKTSIWRAKKYIKKHHDYFGTVEKKFGVDKTVITAIILVETGLGTYMGKRLVINTLSTMAALSDPEISEFLWSSISEEKRLPREKFDKKVNSKSTWAYNELKAFIKYVEMEQLDPYAVYGSYAGAMGIAQFMPSNILSFAQDGNKDGSIDMFNHADAIASIANYLKHYGWHSKIDKEQAQEVLFTYNHSDYYVNILIKISELLKG